MSDDFFMSSRVTRSAAGVARQAKASEATPWSDVTVPLDEKDSDEDGDDEDGEEEDDGDAEEGSEVDGSEEDGSLAEEEDDDGEEGSEEDDSEEDESELQQIRADGLEDQDEDEGESEDEDSEDGEEEGDEAKEEEEEEEEEGAPAAGAKKLTAEAEANGSDAATPAVEESDSEDEMPINTVGNIPLEWYDDFDHVGYDLDGQKILRGSQKDELDALIARFDDPNASRTVHDYLHGVDVVLSDEDVALIRRLQRHRYLDPNMNPYPDAVHYEYADKLHPLSNPTPSKKSFVPSRWEAKKVMRLVMAMRSEQYQKSVENRKKQDAKNKPDYKYLIWDEKSSEAVKHHKRIPPPKLTLPGHAESYNPPREYLYTPEELAAWEKMDPSDRPLNFVPQAYSAYRQVPMYDKLIKERFDRCLDLYLCPRERKTKLNIDPDSLIPKLPKPAELRPFPERLSFSFDGHVGRVYSVSVSPNGESLLTGGQDGTVKLWEVSTGRCERSWILNEGQEVRGVAFCPNGDLDMAAAVCGTKLFLLIPGKTGGKVDRAAAILGKSSGVAADTSDGAWASTSPELKAEGVLWAIDHVKAASMCTWHKGGDYLASVTPDGASKAVLMHQVSKRSSGSPFTKSKGRVESVAFHPSKPLFFVATQRHVRVYHLLRQELVKKLVPSVKWISSIAVHPGGDNVILGSYDKRLCWFDMDLSTSPYKTMHSHKLAVRDVAFHARLPLFASAADDGTVNVYHGRVYADLMTNPLLVPVKRLKAHDVTSHLGTMAIAFHPTQPWIFSAGADGKVHLFTEV